MKEITKEVYLGLVWKHAVVLRKIWRQISGCLYSTKS
jgi:hypothetical protein